MQDVLSAAQEAEAQVLAQRIAQAAQQEFVQIARTLVGADTGSVFGATEFKVREVILRVAAKAYEAYLAEKKTVTRAPASPAPTATKPPPITATGRAAR
jgi:parvulin-like peptidyl-prolyl isomerase